MIDISTGNNSTYSGVILFLHTTVPYEVAFVALLGIVLLTQRVCWVRHACKLSSRNASSDLPHDFGAREHATTPEFENDCAGTAVGGLLTVRVDDYTNNAGVHRSRYTDILVSDNTCAGHCAMSSSEWAATSPVILHASQGGDYTSMLQLLTFD
jgi:hypothetical protein